MSERAIALVSEKPFQDSILRFIRWETGAGELTEVQVEAES